MGEAKNPQMSLILANDGIVGWLFGQFIHIYLYWSLYIYIYIHLYLYNSNIYIYIMCFFLKLHDCMNELQEPTYNQAKPPDPTGFTYARPLNKTIHCTLHSRKIDMSTCITSSVVFFVTERRQKPLGNGKKWWLAANLGTLITVENFYRAK